MKTKLLLLVILVVSFAARNQIARAQGFNSGSDGSMGPLNVTSNTILNLPLDGIFHFTTITVNGGQTLTFNRNAMNTPVYLLATGDVVINGTIAVSGRNGQFGEQFKGGVGGPGGFDGGDRDGDGHGPGAGRTGTDGNVQTTAGGAAYATQSSGASTNKGTVYGSPLLVPLVGGSGSGGSPSGGGGGGGGAILIASNTRIQFSSPGKIESIGGYHPFTVNGGSGGAIRLVAPQVSGNGSFWAFGQHGGGNGRFRVDTIDRAGLAFQSVNSVPFSVGAFMTVFPPGNYRLDIIEAAGTTIPEGTNAPVTITLPFGSDPNRTVTVQARNLNAVLPIEVVLTPDVGSAVKVQTQIDNVAANPATVTVPVTFPINTPVAVNAWLR